VIGSHIPPPWPVYLPDPIARDPLNVGLLSWYLTLPGLDGGNRVYDLKDRLPGTSSGTQAGFWSPGGLLFDGVDDQVSLGNPPVLQQLSRMTVACRVRINATGRQDFIGQWGGAGYHWVLLAGLTANVFSFFGNASNSFPEAPSSVPFVVGVEYYIVGTYDNSTMRIYQDGIETGSAAFAGPLRQDSSLNTYIGRTDDDFSSCLINDIRIYDIALNSRQVWDLRTRSLSGHIGLLNRWQPSRTTIDAAGGPITLVAAVANGNTVATVPTVIKSTRTLTSPVATGDGSTIVPATIKGSLTRTIPVASMDATALPPTRILGPVTQNVPVSSATAFTVQPAITANLLSLPSPVVSANVTTTNPILITNSISVSIPITQSDISTILPLLTLPAIVIVPPPATADASTVPPALLSTLTLAMPVATINVTVYPPVPTGTTLIDVPAAIADADTTGPVVSLSLLSLPVPTAAAVASADPPDVPGGPLTRVPGVATGVANVLNSPIVLSSLSLGIPVSNVSIDVLIPDIVLGPLVLLASISSADSSIIPTSIITFPVSLVVPVVNATMITADTSIVLPFLVIPTPLSDVSVLGISPDPEQTVPPLVPGVADVTGLAASPDLIPAGVAMLGVPVAEADVLAAGPGIETELAESLSEAIVQAFHASPLALAFGEVNPEFRPKIRVRKAFADDEPPYITIAGGEDARARGESPDADGNSYPIEESTFQATVYAYSDADARDLGESFSDYMIDQVGKGAVRFAGGTVMSFQRINPYQAPFRDPEKGPNGTFVYGQVLRFRVIIGA
jgi:hypothetical protein